MWFRPDVVQPRTWLGRMRKRPADLASSLAAAAEEETEPQNEIDK